MKRAVALNPKPDTLLDHLGVLAAVLKTPLIVTEEKTLSLAREFYPQVEVIFMDLQEITFSFLTTHFDVLFVTSKRWAIELFQLIPLFGRKDMRVIYCPHGNSDKGHSFQEHGEEDISLVYGDHMLDLLRDTKALSKIRKTYYTGNYRYHFFKENEAFYRNLAEKKVFEKLSRKKKTLLYAPTWKGEESGSSFYTDCEQLIRQVSCGFNLLIKLHPYLLEEDPARVFSIIEKYKEHPQVLFLEDFPPIYPILALSDGYLGDFSSIGYDFLSFDRPMYFFDPDQKKDRGSFLHRCGMTVSTKTENVFETIEKSFEKNRRAYSLERKKMYEYVFHPYTERL